MVNLVSLGLHSLSLHLCVICSLVVAAKAQWLRAGWCQVGLAGREAGTVVPTGPEAQNGGIHQSTKPGEFGTVASTCP